MSRTRLGYPISAYKYDKDLFFVSVGEVTRGVCIQILRGSNPSDTYIDVNGETSKGQEGKNICLTAGNRLDFYFDMYGSKEWCGGELCKATYVCDKESQSCACPENKHEEGGVCVCDLGLESCKEGCYEPCQQAGMTGIRDENSCTCLCDTALGFNEKAVNGYCTCPVGYLNIDGECKRFGCSGGTPGGNDWNCCLGSTQEECTQTDPAACGQGCTQQGQSCQYGFCTDMCPDGTTWGNIGLVDGNRRNLYGCINRSYDSKCTVQGNGRQCYKEFQGINYYCGQFCSLVGTNCMYGDCVNYCPKYANTEYSPPWSLAYFWGCKQDNGLFCMNGYFAEDKYGGRKYNCYQDKVACAQDCYGDGTDCKINLCNQNNNSCPEGTTYGEIRNMPSCIYDDGYFCIYQGTCRSSEDFQCGAECNEQEGGFGINRSNCRYGTCDPQICQAYGLVIQRITPANYYGCGDANGHLVCYKSINKYICYKDGVQCGTNCTDFFGTGCDGCISEFQCPVGWTETIHKAQNACTNGEIVCTEQNKMCYYIGQEQSCAQECSLDGNCQISACTSAQANCPANTIFTHVIWTGPGDEYKGCLNMDANVKCVYMRGTYDCYGGTNERCGTGCKADGTDCQTGLCSCPPGQELIGGTCQEISSELSCSSGVCMIGNRYCGSGCEEDGTNCQVGSCNQTDASCPEGTHFGRVTNEFYGCIHDTTYVSCYQYEGTYVCFKNGTQCGTECSADGTGGTCDVGCS